MIIGLKHSKGILYNESAKCWNFVLSCISDIFLTFEIYFSEKPIFLDVQIHLVNI